MNKGLKSLSTLQIGKLGELLVQYKLLKFGIESSCMTTDSGIDLVAYSSGKKRARTIQVKANLKPTPGGGRGRLSLGWWVPEDTPAELFAFADVSNDLVWLLTMQELKRLAQQHSNLRYHFYLNIDPEHKARKQTKEARVSKFENYLLENRALKFF